ncbi:hypothetical protein BWI75_04555 [Gloeocapsopsis sp. AAB1 = 1H9]|uniref:Uncharacterized protein n=1 Tax=Gloeocapsopsis dulcis AAB1 = 1H9 TaxID=1433147 RepID=A0A6N8FR39_9CHRO|nr:hypothetical protein [Gloeocapsopsis dulcis AAB1 = 1H9]
MPNLNSSVREPVEVESSLSSLIVLPELVFIESSTVEVALYDLLLFILTGVFAVIPLGPQTVLD